MKILKVYTTSFNSIGIIPLSENMTGLKLVFIVCVRKIRLLGICWLAMKTIIG